MYINPELWKVRYNYKLFKYTTAAWADGTFNPEYDTQMVLDRKGFWLLLSGWRLGTDTNAYIYKQYQVIVDSKAEIFPYKQALYQARSANTAGNSSGIVIHTGAQLIRVNTANAVIKPYIHTDAANILTEIKFLAVYLGNL